MEVTKQGVHIVLVHGACHGAWSWYKVKLLIEAAGHRVTAIDLAAAGIDLRKLHEVRTFSDYTQPLLEVMASIPAEEKVVLVGHSFGGLSLSLAMEMYPHKITVAVFISAFLPDTIHPPSYVVEQFFERIPAEEWLDTKFLSYGEPNEQITSLSFGPNCISSKIYHLSSPEDMELAKMLVRPVSLFLDDLSKKNKFSKQGFESVKRVYIVCRQDKTIPAEFQLWQIQNSGGVSQVKEIQNADHMPMMSTPNQLCQLILDIANNYI